MSTTSLPSHIFRARDKKLALGERTALMGVVNVTPDSFYEGSRYPEVSEAVEVALALIEAGADIAHDAPAGRDRQTTTHGVSVDRAAFKLEM